MCPLLPRCQVHRLEDQCLMFSHITPATRARAFPWMEGSQDSTGYWFLLLNSTGECRMRKRGMDNGVQNTSPATRYLNITPWHGRAEQKQEVLPSFLCLPPLEQVVTEILFPGICVFRSRFGETLETQSNRNILCFSLSQRAPRWSPCIRRAVPIWSRAERMPTSLNPTSE